MLGGRRLSLAHSSRSPQAEACEAAWWWSREGSWKLTIHPWWPSPQDEMWDHRKGPGLAKHLRPSPYGPPGRKVDPTEPVDYRGWRRKDDTHGSWRLPRMFPHKPHMGPAGNLSNQEATAWVMATPAKYELSSPQLCSLHPLQALEEPEAAW